VQQGSEMKFKNFPGDEGDFPGHPTSHGFRRAFRGLGGVSALEYNSDRKHENHSMFWIEVAVLASEVLNEVS